MKKLKKCSKCGELKSHSEFYKDKQKINTGARPDCKKCTNISSIKWSKNNPEKRKYYLIKSDSGLTKDQYKILEKYQENRCAICGREEQDNKRWSIDHDHNTMLIRGLLCHYCNVGLGCFFDNIINLEKAILYLKDNYSKNGYIHQNKKHLRDIK